MATQDIYAALSAEVYNDKRGAPNQNPLPRNWFQLAYEPEIVNGVPAAGLSIGAFSDGSEIVIAIKGTDFLVGKATGAAVDDFLADAGLGLGLGSEQVRQAALFYAKVKAQNPGVRITFTGHSLGAGLASILSVWFNEPATVFADAPFYLSSINGDLIKSTSNLLRANGFPNAALESLVLQEQTVDGITTVTVDRNAISARESNIVARYVQGEVLNSVFGGRLT